MQRYFHTAFGQGLKYLYWFYHYNAQKSNPVKGDWIQFLKVDFELIGEEVNEKLARETTKTYYKNIFKSKIREEVFNILKRTQGTHTKVNTIVYHTFKIQEYMKSHTLTNHEVSLLFSLRRRTFKNVKKQLWEKRELFTLVPNLRGSRALVYL